MQQRISPLQGLPVIKRRPRPAAAINSKRSTECLKVNPMKTKTGSKQVEKRGGTAPQKNAAEEKLQAAMQRLRSNPSFVIGALIVAYCIVRLVFSV
jgi:hypothetical protein